MSQRGGAGGGGAGGGGAACRRKRERGGAGLSQGTGLLPAELSALSPPPAQPLPAFAGETGCCLRSAGFVRSTAL